MVTQHLAFSTVALVVCFILLLTMENIFLNLLPSILQFFTNCEVEQQKS